MIILIIVVLLYGVFLNNKKNDRGYNDLLVNTCKKINLYSYTSKETCRGISNAWYASIRDRYDYDFNDNIEDYLEENEDTVQKIKEMRNGLTANMKKLKDVPNKKYNNVYKETVDLYSSFSTLVDLVLSPSGSYTTYFPKCDEYWEKINSHYNKLKILIPELEKVSIVFENVPKNFKH